jgi:hypothetical protein
MTEAAKKVTVEDAREHIEALRAFCVAYQRTRQVVRTGLLNCRAPCEGATLPLRRRSTAAEAGRWSSTRPSQDPPVAVYGPG